MASPLVCNPPVSRQRLRPSRPPALRHHRNRATSSSWRAVHCWCPYTQLGSGACVCGPLLRPQHQGRAASSPLSNSTAMAWHLHATCSHDDRMEGNSFGACGFLYLKLARHHAESHRVCRAVPSKTPAPSANFPRQISLTAEREFPKQSASSPSTLQASWPVLLFAFGTLRWPYVSGTCRPQATQASCPVSRPLACGLASTLPLPFACSHPFARSRSGCMTRHVTTHARMPTRAGGTPSARWRKKRCRNSLPAASQARHPACTGACTARLSSVACVLCVREQPAAQCVCSPTLSSRRLSWNGHAHRCFRKAGLLTGRPTAGVLLHLLQLPGTALHTPAQQWQPRTNGVHECRQYRDTFINAYRANPLEPLPLTKAKSLVVGDYASVAR